MFDLLLAVTNPGLRRTRWSHDGVELERERHAFTGPKHGLTIEIFTLTQPGRRGWLLMVTKEYWWVGEEGRAFKNIRWARHLGGQRADLLAWLRAQEARLEQAPSSLPNTQKPSADAGITSAAPKAPEWQETDS